MGRCFFLLPNQSMETNIIFFNFLTPLVGFLSFLGLIYAAKRSTIYGNCIYLGWLLAASSILLYVIGDVIWAFLEVVLHVQPFPSAADIFYLLYYLFFLMGTVFIIQAS